MTITSDNLKLKHRSKELTHDPERAPARAMLMAMGLTIEDMDKPFVAIASLASDVTPCNVHLDRVAEADKAGAISFLQYQHYHPEFRRHVETVQHHGIGQHQDGAERDQKHACCDSEHERDDCGEHGKEIFLQIQARRREPPHEDFHRVQAADAVGGHPTDTRTTSVAPAYVVLSVRLTTMSVVRPSDDTYASKNSGYRARASLRLPKSPRYASRDIPGRMFTGPFTVATRGSP